jgi:hypothetical protein
VAEAQTGRTFYAGFADYECAGPVPLGMVDVDPYYWSGQIGHCLEVFEEARTNRRIYDVVPNLERRTRNFTAFAPRVPRPYWTPLKQGSILPPRRPSARRSVGRLPPWISPITAS